MDQKPASFYGSPQEALKAPPEEFLYLACLHEGTGVDAPDFLAVVDSATSFTTSAGTAAARPVTARIART